MPEKDRISCMLTHPMPGRRRDQVLLMLFRRMAIYGFHDARATMLALDHFGSGFPRALHLIRAFLHGLARHASGRIRVAPCCAPRLTRHEALVISAMVEGCPVALLELSGQEGYRELLALSRALQAELAEA